MSQSEELSRAFYDRLGADGLARRTRSEWDEATVAALVEVLPPRARVLDVGCGYGRITFPLACAGFELEGLDHSETMIEAAHGAAEREDVAVRLTVGSMTSLPYPSASFDAAICLWSAFNELLEAGEQIRTLSEIWRVLRPGGVGVVEGRPYAEPSEAEIESGARRGPNHRIDWELVEGILNPHYRHDERSFRRICDAAGVTEFTVCEREWGGRERLVLRMDKPFA